MTRALAVLAIALAFAPPSFDADDIPATASVVYPFEGDGGAYIDTERMIDADRLAATGELDDPREIEAETE